MLAGVENDVKFADGLQSYYFYKLGSDTERKHVSNVVQRQISARDAVASGGAYTTRDVVLRVSASEFDLFSPEVGGLVEHASKHELWYIVESMTAVHESRKRLVCRRSNANNLNTTVTLLETTYSKDSDFSPSPVWNALATGIPAAIEEVRSLNIVSQERRFVQIEYRIYLKTALNVLAGMQVKTSDNETYHVIGVSGKGVLGGLVVCDVVRPAGPTAA